MNRGHIWRYRAILVLFGMVTSVGFGCASVDSHVKPVVKIEPGVRTIGPPVARHASTSPAEQNLEKIIPKLHLTRVSFDQAVAALRQAASVPIVVDVASLDAAGFDRSVPVTVWGEHVSIEAVLDRLLEPNREYSLLTYTLRDGTIEITTRQKAAELRFERTYNVRGLAQGAEQRQQMIKLIVETVSPDSWTDAGGSTGTIRCVGDQLVVVQSWYEQRSVEGLLVALREWETQSEKPDVLLSPGNTAAECDLRRVLPEVNLQSIPFERAVQKLTDLSGTRIDIDGVELNSKVLDRLERVTLHLFHTTLADALQKLLDAHRGEPRLTYVVDDGRILIRLREKAAAEIVTRVYDVHDWLPEIPLNPSPLISYPIDSWYVDELGRKIAANVAPEKWGNDKFKIKTEGGTLVITQTREVHERIAEFLSAERARRKNESTSRP